MGQQPNIERDASDFPRLEPQPGVARRWQPGRPGEIGSPAEAVSGGAFGRPGPDTGWVLRLVRNADFERGSHPGDLEALVASVGAARASLHGRGPTPTDVEVALILLGLREEGIPTDVFERLAAARADWLKKAAHEPVKGQGFLARVSSQMLRSDPDHLRHLLNVAGLAGQPG